MGPAPKVCPATGSGCEYNCIDVCGSRRVAVEPDPDIAYVALSRQALTDLLAAPLGPLVIMGLEPRGPGYELIVRAPNLMELAAAIEKCKAVDAALADGRLV
jgi:hypothetical protein